MNKFEASHHGTAHSVPSPAFVESIDPLSADTRLYHIRLDSSIPANELLPGRFMQVSMPAGGEVPISICGTSHNESLQLCIRTAGHVTRMMQLLRPGSRIGIRGPFGSGFPVNEWRGRNILLLAGGLGIAPLRGLLHYLLQHRGNYRDITLMYGARNPSALLFRDELTSLSCQGIFRLLLTVDFLEGDNPDFSCNTGLLTELLAHSSITVENTAAAVCGPPALYRCLVGELEQAGIRDNDIHLSLERRMKCGTGLCCHCALGDLFCCTDGPVFTYRSIRNIAGAL